MGLKDKIQVVWREGRCRNGDRWWNAFIKFGLGGEEGKRIRGQSLWFLLFRFLFDLGETLA